MSHEFEPGGQEEDAQEAAQKWLDELVVLSFRDNKRGGDPIAHTADGRAVFPDKFQGGDDIRPGEHWVCSVSQKGESTFFAAPVKRMDSDLILQLSEEERRRFAQIAVQEYQEAFDAELQPLLKDQEPFQGSTHELERERDELQERLLELNDQYDEALARLQEAEERLQGQKEPSPTPEERDAGRRGESHASVERDEHYPVVREDDDVLYCQGFTDGHYHGHVSPNQRRLFLKSYGRGPIPCEDGRIEVPGLSRLLPDDVEELVARYDPRHGGFFMEIPPRD